MRKILAVAVLMIVGLSSVFAGSGVQEPPKGTRKYQGYGYTSEIGVFQSIANDISLNGIFGYSLNGANGLVMTLATESEVLESVLVPDYIKEAVKEGFAYSTYGGFSHNSMYLEKVQAYKLENGKILVVELHYISLSDLSSKENHNTN